MKTKLFTAPLFLSVMAVCLAACQKSPKDNPGNGNGSGPDTVVIIPPVDPAIANTIGFFLNDWAAKSFVQPTYTDTTLPAIAPTVFVNVDASSIITKVPGPVFGQNANVYMTPMITEPSLMSNITNLHPNVIRFPGGSLSDVYFWNEPGGVTPRDAPATLLDANGNAIAAGYWYGQNSQSWTASLDNYYSMLQQTGNQGIITINYAYARYGTGPAPVSTAAHLAADWVRYDNGRTQYWEIGNEDNGTWEAGYRIDLNNNHDGQAQIITGDLYGTHYTIFADSMRAAAQQIGKTIYIGAQLLEKQPESWQTPTDQTWNTGVLTRVNASADFYIVHSYFTPYQENSSAAVILNTAIDNTTAMMNYLKTSFSNAGAVVKPVALTEWNITSQGSMQQVSYIDGMHAAILLGEALKNKYGETSRWDFANGWNNGNDHGLFNIGDEPGVPKWNPRPAFYYMYYFQKTIGDRMLSSTITGSTDILSYGSSYNSGQNAVIIVNKGTSLQKIQVSLKNAVPGNRFYWYTLTGGTDNGEFSKKVFVNGKGPDNDSGGPSAYESLNAYSATTANGINISIPARAVIYMVIDKK
ncbi:MAG: alpha-L-arabinofuranosidase [Ginsengibacter sp.]